MRIAVVIDPDSCALSVLSVIPSACLLLQEVLSKYRIMLQYRYHLVCGYFTNT